MYQIWAVDQEDQEGVTGTWTVVGLDLGVRRWGQGVHLLFSWFTGWTLP